MTIRIAVVATALPIVALALSGCVSQSKYEELQTQNQQLQQQVTNLQKEAQFVEAGDLLFPPGGYQLSQAGQAELSKNIVPKLIGLQDAKVVVYGYTDNLLVGPPLQRAGIANNIDLSSRRVDKVVAYLTSQGVNPSMISAKGFGDTHPVASNDAPDGRSKNRRIEIVLEGPGA